MAKYSGTLAYKGLVTEVDGDIVIVEERKVGKDTVIEESHNFTQKLRDEYIGKKVSITVKEDIELDPSDEATE